MFSSLKILGICLLLTLLAGAQVKVKSYTRKDGTVVAGYTRKEPTRGNTNDKAPTINGRRVLSASGHCAVVDPGFIVCGDKVMKDYVAPVPGVPVVRRDSHGRIKRNPGAKADFEYRFPCPANGHSRGRCPGYVVDHIVPLACGGMDDPLNMQWQTVADGKAKDKWERKGCK